MKINDLMTSYWRIISYSCFKDKYYFPVSFLKFCGVTSAIGWCATCKRSLKLTMPGEKNSRKCTAVQQTQVRQLTNSLSPKNVLTQKKTQKNWIKDYELHDVETLDWESIYLLPRICILSTILRNFQFKFLHRRTATICFPFNKFSESNLCCFFQTAQEMLLHLYWECPITEAFWISVQQFFISVD